MESIARGNCLKGRAALVTGGRRGIGKAVALALAGEGADVAVCDISTTDGLLEKAREALLAAGSKALALQADVSRREDVESMVGRVADTYGKIDILVNCAGVWIPGETLVECSDQNWDQVIDTNLKGTYLCCQAVGKTMIPRKSGCIINLSSQVGLTPGAGGGAYSISKAGIIMLTRQLALELAEHRIRVNAIAPGIVKTDFNAAFWKDPQVETRTSSMVPLGRLADPEDVAQSALFLASDGAGYITGEVICINGGWKPSSQLK
jgi:NAD(P)-dependent dehydrogenase (short-subunit alcohol dehydrogenase family)